MSREHSIIKVGCHHTQRSYAQPWTVREQNESTGSGFYLRVANRDYVMTNAHCVAAAEAVTLRRSGYEGTAPATIRAIVYECDLALLETNAAGFYDGIEPLQLGGLPAKLSKVYVYGYPLGGLNVSIAKGVVNRMQIVPYFGMVNSIAIQIDAPVNFGNSGGPVLDSDGLVVGVAFSGEDDAQTQNMGYMIPTLLVNYFLRVALSKAGWQGLCSLGIETQTTENAALRRYYRLPAAGGGLLITQSDDPGLRADDILLALDDAPVSATGLIPLNSLLPGSESISEVGGTDERSSPVSEVVPYVCYVSLQLPGSQIVARIWRGGKERRVRLTCTPRPPRIPLVPSQQEPDAVVFAGLVFVPLTYMWVEEKRRAGIYLPTLVPYLEGETPRIMLSEVQRTNATIGYNFQDVVLEAVNNTTIRTLAELQRALAAAKKEKFVVFTFADVSARIIISAEDE